MGSCRNLITRGMFDKVRVGDKIYFTAPSIKGDKIYHYFGIAKITSSRLTKITQISKEKYREKIKWIGKNLIN